MSFSLNGYATLLALTVSSAGGAENPEPYVTLKIEAVQQPTQPALEAIGGADADRPALESLHDHTDPDRNPRFWGIESIAASAEYKGRHTLTLGGVQVRAAKVSGIKIAPTRGGHWTITCNVGIEQPPPRAIDRWAELLRGRETRVELAADPDLDLKPASAALGEIKRMAAQDGSSVTLTRAPGDAMPPPKAKVKRGKPNDKRSPA